MITKTIYICEYCKREYKREYNALEHEDKCWSNPKCKTCFTCGNYEGKSGFSTVEHLVDMDKGGYGSIICSINKHDIVRLETTAPVENCPNWTGKL